MKKTAIAICCFAFTQLPVFGQDSATVEAPDTNKICPSKVQVTLITPIGSNGLKAWECTHQVSINILAGHSAGLDGIEIGGFYNGISNDAKGFQFSGFANYVGGNTDAGQFAGFCNVGMGNVQGVQAAGFINVGGATVKGGQLAGFVNISTKGFHGVQASGFANVSNGNSRGFQGAGFMNLQHGDVKGIQLAGFMNLSSGRVEGLQGAGFVNVAKKLKGLQLGFINLVDSLEEGVQIGFFNHASNGIHDIELGTNETFLVNVKYKTGSNKFFTFFSGSAMPSNGKSAWAIGYGLGARKPLTKRWYVEPSLAVNQVHEDQGWNRYYLNLQHRLELNLGLDLKALRLSVGPSFNVWVSNREEAGSLVGSRLIPYRTNYVKGVDVLTIMYPGFQANLAF